jgi:glycine cleavage system aminomethyltransferase T/glycine/D-amino acid oxidase-like deaminating enzyme
MQSVNLPQRARAVVIGGGVIGCSVAYHLAEMGVRDVVLLERDRITSGTTWHAAGLMVTFGSTSETSTELRKYTRSFYQRVEKETGMDSGFRPVGFIQLATDPDHLEEYRRVSAFNRHCGIDVQEISAREVKELWPLAHVDDVLAGFYVKEDGRANPVDVTMAIARAAKLKGATIIEGVPVVDILKKNGTVTGVRTAQGDIEAEFVVNCAGMWARQLGAKAGVAIPLQSTEHYYLITEPIPEVSTSWPILEDPNAYAYLREEGGGLLVGLFEPIAAPWSVDGVPEDFSFGELEPDWERMGPYVEAAMKRAPRSMEVGVKKFFCGPESFTADLRPCLGEAPELKNFFVAAGLNSIGILTGGGVGRVIAHWIVNGRPDVDITGFNIDRLQTYQANPLYRKHRTSEMLGMVYKCHYPGKSLETARGAKRSIVHDRLVSARACFKDVSGWEGADWYAPEGTEPRVLKYSWGRPSFFSQWKAEHDATRNGVILMDMSFMSKFAVQGRDAGEWLDYISGNRVDGDSGLITYTQWLNDDGKLEADLTVVKRDDERFIVVATDTAHRHVETWMKRHIPREAHAFVTDVTSSYCQLNVQGPESRKLMSALTSVDMSNEAFPYRGVREIDVGYARVICVRITYLGELGYELYIPSEQATHVYDLIVEEGKKHGLVHAGLKALSSLRLEKGYRDYGHDIDNTDTVLEAGLGFAVDLKKPSFIGRDAVLRQKELGGLKKRLVSVLMSDPEPMLFHAEPLLRDGKSIGYLRAGSYGHTLGASCGLAMVEWHEPITPAWLAAGKWEVDVAGRRWPATVSLKPLYDPEMKRIKC